MHEIVHQLADQARKSIPKGELDVDQWLRQYNETFARLIVEQCIAAGSGRPGKIITAIEMIIEIEEVFGFFYCMEQPKSTRIMR